MFEARSTRSLLSTIITRMFAVGNKQFRLPSAMRSIRRRAALRSYRECGGARLALYVKLPVVVWRRGLIVLSKNDIISG